MSISSISRDKKDLEKLKDMIEAETLERSYLFPASPWDESVCEQVLSAQFVSDSLEVYHLQFKVGRVTLHLQCALSASDKKRSFGRPKVELDLNSLELLLLSQQPLLRLDGRHVRLEEVKNGRYIMACSLSVPDCWDSPAWDLAVKSNELYAQRPHDFELIIVAKFRRNDGWDKYANFRRFFKPFHQSCIVIPLHDHIEELLDFHGLENNQALLIDPKGNVLLQKDLSVLTNFGSAAFPFTHISSLWAEYWRLNPSSLVCFLGFKPSHKVLRKIPGTEPLLEEHRCISEFQSKIVLLYLYCVGDQLAFLYNTVIGLREKGIEFEILTAYVPAGDQHNPLQFIEVFSSLVAQRGLSWWVVPFDSSMYPRLRPLYAKTSDQLIVFDPKLNDGDPHGLEVMSLYGESMFPFTKMFVVEHVMKELSQVTLKYLLEPITDLCKEGHDDSVDEVKTVLEGKNVLVYFHSFWSNPTPVLDPFVSWYESLEDKKRDFEVVFVSLDPHQEDDDFRLRFRFPIWSVFRDDEEVHSKYVVDNFFLRLFKHEFSTIVAFGKDGKIRSLRAHSLISSSKAKVGTFPFNGHLPGEVFKILNDYCNEKLPQQ